MNEKVCPINNLLEESGGQWIKVEGKDEKGKIVGLHIVCIKETAEYFAPIVEAFEKTFKEYE